jgi:hypothetical protein
MVRLHPYFSRNFPAAMKGSNDIQMTVRDTDATYTRLHSVSRLDQDMELPVKAISMGPTFNALCSNVFVRFRRRRMKRFFA